MLLLATTLVSSIFAGCGKKKPAADSTETSVDDGFMCGYEFTAVLNASRKTEAMIVLVYRAADGAERIVAVCEDVWYRKFFQSTRRARGLYDTDVRDVVRRHGVEFYFQLIAARDAVSAQYAVRDSLLARGGVGRLDELTVFVFYSVFM